MLNTALFVSTRPFTRQFLGALCLLVALCARPGTAQVVDIEPYYVVPASDQVLLRCSDGISWYPTAQVNRQSLLKADGQAGDWLRVTYPADGVAVVGIGDATVDRSRGVVELTHASRLRALNQGDQVFDECFKALLADRLMPGTELPYLGDIKSRQGQVAGYRVQAPEQARAFVLQNQVRKATDEEVARLASSSPGGTPQGNASGSGAPATPQRDARPDTTPATQPVDQAAEGAEPADPAEKPAITADSESDESVITMSRLAKGQDDAEAALAETPGDSTPPDGFTGEDVAALEDTMARLEKLDQSFEAMAREPLETAEFAPLIVEYDRFRTQLNGDDAVISDYVTTRIELLQLRLQLQRQLNEVRRLEASAQAATTTFEQSAAARAARGRDYLLVGRLMVSTLYDGNRLPLMYRLMSVDGVANRTLAYLTPNNELAIDSKLNAIVGVRGEGNLDPGARVKVIQPTAIDVLEPASD